MNGMASSVGCHGKESLLGSSEGGSKCQCIPDTGHVRATVPLVNSRVAQLHRMPIYMINSPTSTTFDDTCMSLSPPIQTLANSATSSTSTPNSGGTGMHHPYLNEPSQDSFSLPLSQIHLSAADFEALESNLTTWGGNGNFYSRY